MFKKGKGFLTKTLMYVLSLTTILAVTGISLIYMHLQEQKIRDVYDEFTNKVLLQNMR